MTPAFRLCDDYVRQWAALDPVMASEAGLREPFVAATDYGPDGVAARSELTAATLTALDGVTATSADDELAAALLRERLTAESAWYESGEPLRLLRAQFGLTSFIRDSVDLLPRGTPDEWRDVAARLAAIPRMLLSWRAGLTEGLRQGLPAARRQAFETALQATRYADARTHDDLVAGYGSGSLAGSLADAAALAYEGYAELARWLREDYAPRASQTDAVGPERYAVEARLHLGADVDLHEAYEYGWSELRRIEAELAAEAGQVSPGATVAEAAAILDGSAYVTGPDAYRAWLRDQHDQAINRLHGALFDIPEPLRTVDVVLSASSTSGAPYYTPPSEDLTRPGRTCWPLGGRERFTVWRELTSVFHEGVPGHHLQIGTVLTAGARLSRFARCTHVFAHSEGWALYAERLADELGWYTEPGTRLGMLQAAALRAARVVIDIGLHLGLPLPDGSRWSFEKACAVRRDRGRAEPHRVHPEIVRYCAWPAQAITFKLGERAWLAARDEAARRPGFDVRQWHARALALGPVGLAGMAGMLR